MRFVALAVILLMLPLFVVWLQSSPKNRDMALTLFGLLVFVTGDIQVDAAIYSWPFWQGTSRGLLISPADMLVLALLITRKPSGKALPFIWLMACYLAVLVLSVGFSRVPMASMFSVWDFGRVFLAFLAVGVELARPAAYSALLRGLSIGLMIQAGYVINEKLHGVVQARGTMAHQNLLGMVTEITFLNLLAAVLEGNRSRLLKLGLLAGLIIAAGGGSRATLGLIGGASVLLIVVSLLRKSTPRKTAMAAASVGLLLAAIPFAMGTLEDRFGGLEVTTEETQRAAMEKAAHAMSSDHPFGVGANLYVSTANTDGYSQRAGVSWWGMNLAVPVHNSYLLARAELGYQGQAMFMLLLLVPLAAGLRHAFRHRRSSRDGWVLGSVAALGAIAVHSSYEFNTMIYTVQLPLMINIAIIAGLIRASRIEGAATNKDTPAPERSGARGQMAVARMPIVPTVGAVPRRQEQSADGRLPLRSQETRN
ncbi:MAG TPA: hypothetical protein VNS34_12125 [Rhizobiaceae bacterium]|nr:hypothetical protein [Rhizobiaceae bacterium]